MKAYDMTIRTKLNFQHLLSGAVAIACLAATPAFAVLHSQTYTVTDPSGRAAQATFSTNAACVSNCTLTIQLTNTAINNPGDPTEVLTGLFFNFAGSPSMTAGTANVAAGSTVITTNAGTVSTLYGAGTNVGSEWAFKQGALSVGANTFGYGISAAGLGIFGGTDLFCQGGAPGCPVLIAGNAGAAPDGLAFGIVPTTYTGANANGGVTGRSLERSSVVFTLNSVPGDLTGMINGLRFQYGTAINEFSVSVPEPSTLVLLGLGVFGMLRVRARRRVA
jgi:PEP-CTERM motif